MPSQRVVVVSLLVAYVPPKGLRVVIRELTDGRYEVTIEPP